MANNIEWRVRLGLVSRQIRMDHLQREEARVNQVKNKAEREAARNTVFIVGGLVVFGGLLALFLTPERQYNLIMSIGDLGCRATSMLGLCP